MEKIIIDNITKDYGNNKGVFNVSFTVKAGEIVGFLGPNGAGKTTTIRQLMGFIKPQSGTVSILGKDCFKDASLIHSYVGYVPGEISFVDEMNGNEFIDFVGKSKGVTNIQYINELIAYFELNPSGKIKKMSKGMKQKIALVCAFMNDPDIYILDEPTSGLDPLMQNKFVDFILKKKSEGKTILMSSHIFEEIERTCDRVAIIKDGKIVAIDDVETLVKNKKKTFIITLKNTQDVELFTKLYPDAIIKKNTIEVTIDDYNHLLNNLHSYEIIDIDIKKQSLEELFLHFYGGQSHDK